MTEGEIEAMAKAICEEAGKSVNKRFCSVCENGPCTLWKEFKLEARAARRAYQKVRKANGEDQ